MSYDSLQKVECENGYYLKHPEATVETGAVIGADTKIWANTRIFSGAVVGRNCVIAADVHVEGGAILGNNCKVQRGITLYNGVKAEDYVFFGPNSTTTNDLNPRAFGPWELTGTKIETGASIGAGALLICGNDIGALAFVGAGAVVTKPVEACQLVTGNPARFHGWVGPGGQVISRNETRPEELDKFLVNPLAAIEKYLRTMAPNE